MPLTGAFSELEDVIGRSVIYPIGEHQPILDYDVALAGSGIGLTVLLYQIANDPNSSKFDSTKLAGEAAFAPTAAELQQVFDRLAYKILLRITR